MKKTYLFALGLCAAALVAGAQEPAAGAGNMRAPRIAVIDMAEISSKSNLGKSYASRIEGLENEIRTEGNKKQAELNKQDAAIKALQEELEKQGSVLSADALDKKRQDITRKQRDRQAFFEDGQADLQRMRERAEQQAGALNAEFQQKLKPAIDAAAKAKSVDIILTNQVALIINPEFDLTKDIITRADSMAPAPAPAAAAAPAAPRPAASPAAPAPKPSPASSPRP
jgi:Skp family chaperone for outer membrane proteins